MSLAGQSASSILKRTRECPNCKRKQVAPHGKSRESIRCNHCGADIPPKRG